MSSHQHAVDRSEAASLLVTPDLRVSHANEAAHAMLGYPLGQLSGVEMVSLLQPRRHAELRNFEQLLEGGGARRWRTVLSTYTGQFRDVAVALSACLDDRGHIEAVHVKLEHATRTSVPPKDSGVHASVRREGMWSEAPTASRKSGLAQSQPAPGARTAPPMPLTSIAQLRALRETLEEARARVSELEARSMPLTEPLDPGGRIEVARASREARALIDEAIALLGSKDDRR